MASNRRVRLVTLCGLLCLFSTVSANVVQRGDDPKDVRPEVKRSAIRQGPAGAADFNNNNPPAPAGAGAGGGGFERPNLEPNNNAGAEFRQPQQLGRNNQNIPKRGDFRPQPLQNVNAPVNVQKPPSPKAQGHPVRIADHPACKEDVASLCGKNSQGNNFAVLDCLQNANEANTRLSDGCNQFLWNYKMNLTKDVRFDSAAFEVCKSDVVKFADCNGIARGQGLVLPCLYDHLENITAVQCRQYVNRMKSITFSDYRLIQGFYDKCRADINDKGCGIVNENNPSDKPAPINPHKQGSTINCLEKKLEDLNDDCKKEIGRVAELTSEDYHTDRSLFFACRDDRERFCEEEAAGHGQIYKCLLKHKFRKDMSEGCRNKLTTRQKVVSEDYRANYALVRKCRDDMRKTNCLPSKERKNREHRLSTLLLCLEKASKRTKLSGDCTAELEDTRKSLMNDYMINPEIITSCQYEITSSCPGLEREGNTLRCLMKLAAKTKKALSEKCETALQNLVKTADAGANYRIDAALHRACQPVRAKICKDEKAGDAKVLSCLMENIYAKDMTEECESELLLLQYFVSRDFQLDPLLFKQCRDDVTQLCNMDEEMENSDTPKGIIFACLHRNLHDDENNRDAKSPLSASCQAQVHRVLRQRAVSVHLNPLIEEECRKDLGEYCVDHTGKGEELACLQDNIEDLEDECRKKIGDLTVEESEDIKMNRKLMGACAPMIKQFCKEFLTKKVDEGAALQCLIDHKNEEEMNKKCQAGIEHFQLIQLKEFRFNFKFKEACRKDVISNCKESKDKSSIVKCLSTAVRDDTLKEAHQRISEECRKQLKSELLQRSEDVHLDPELFKGCEADIKRLCSNVESGNARVLECLRSNKKDLEEPCHIKLFNRQKEEVSMVETDYAFMHACKKMIKLFCQGTNPQLLFKCLKTHRSEPTFDTNCKAVLTKRAISRSEDFRLNPILLKSCKRDMTKFCKDIEDSAKNKELEGALILCLKKQFASTKNLSPDCEHYIRDMIQDSAMDYRLDPILVRVCKTTIEQLCSSEVETPGAGQVEECLKKKLMEGKIQDIKCRLQVIYLVQQGRADVHVDPVLYKACALDIKHYCVGIPQGEGRHMSCLIAASDDKSVKLQPDCKRMVVERRQMWSYAVKVQGPDSLSDLVYSINASESRGYFLTVLLVIIGVLFFSGMCCGRASKRIRAELKNK